MDQEWPGWSKNLDLIPTIVWNDVAKLELELEPELV